MKKRVFALAAVAVMAMSVCAFAEDFDASKGEGVEAKIAVITMDQMDVHWVRLEEAAEARAAAYNVAGANIELTWYAPETKDNAQPIQ